MSKYTLNDFEPGAYRILWEDGQSRGGCIFTGTTGVKMIVCSNWVWPGVLSDALGGIVEAVRLDNPPRLVPRGPFPPRPDESDGAAGPQPQNSMMEAAGFTGVHSRLNALCQIFDDLRGDMREQLHKLQVEQAGIVSLLEAVHGEVSSPMVVDECVKGCETVGMTDFSVFGFVDSAGRLNVYRLPEDAGEFRQHVEVFGRHLLLFDGGLYLIEGGKLVKL